VYTYAFSYSINKMPNNHIQNTTQKTRGEGELRCSGSVNSSISTGGTRRFTLLANQVKSHEWVKHRGLWLRKTAQEPAYVAYQNNFA